MSHLMLTVEATGTIEEGRRINLDQSLPDIGRRRVRLIVFLEEDTDIDEQEWLRAASTNSAFAFLADEPNLYTLADGEPFRDEG